MVYKSIHTKPLCVVIVLIIFKVTDAAMTRKQLQSSFDMMRGVCAPKHKVSIEMLDDLRKGIFVEDKELKCYTLCIAKMAGTMTKKGEISLQKALSQIEVMAPADIKDAVVAVFTACKDVQKDYTDSCDKTFYSTKCSYEANPEIFMFP